MSKRLLVTGGSGFIGANLIRFLLAKYPDYRIINFDLSDGTRAGGRMVTIDNNPGYTFAEGDITSEKDVQDVFEIYRPDFVIHLASQAYIDRSINNPAVFVKTNVIGTQLVLLNARESKIEKIVHFSTSKVYGTCDLLLEKYQKANELLHIIDEECILLPNDPYVASKASADLFVEAAIRSHNLNINIVRPTNVYGSYQTPDKFIPTVIESILNTKKITVFNDVSVSRDWIYIDDLCRAVDLILHKGEEGEIYNVSSGECRENIELINHIKQRMDCYGVELDIAKNKLGDVSYPSISSAKIKTELGWRIQESLESGLEKVIKWYKENQEWVNEAFTHANKQLQ